jgi:hypothetical protein
MDMSDNDQSVLESIARYDSSPWTRTAAAVRLTDQALLEYLARNDPFLYLRERVTEKLTDQSVLEDIARNLGASAVRRKATEKLSDQAVIEDLARNCQDPMVRIAALKRLESQSVVADLLKHDHVPLNIAFDMLTDPTLVLQVAREADRRNVREFAIARLGGYFCKACNAEHLPRDGQPVDCFCQCCNQENHDYRKCYTTNRLKKTYSTWECCERCGMEKNHMMDLEYRSYDD